MKIIKNVITQTDIDTILLHYTNTGTNLYIEKNHGYDINKLINYSSIFYCDIHNVHLRNILDKIIEVDHTIYSIHMIRYTEGGECKKHLDRSSNQTYIFMLSDNFTGGKLLVNDIDSNICKGDVVCFNGQREHHAVTEITRGIRDVLVVWTKPKRNEGTYLI